jgi:beta-lactamase regulating signal transducer with metallopeptidase domain
MIYDFGILDYTWKGLLVVATSATIALAIVFTVEYLFKKSISKRLAKWFFNFHSVVLILILSLCFFIIQTDPELSSACFTKFVEKSDSYTITRIISGAYLFTVGCLFLFDFSGIFLSLLQLKKYPKNTDGKLTKIVFKISSQIKLKEKIEIYTSDTYVSPFVWGLFRFKLVVPTQLVKTLDSEKLEAVLAHELMHIKDKDSFWLLLSHISKRIIFFHPFIHFIEKKHRLAVEMAADEMAITHCGIRAKKLLESLIELASGCVVQKSRPLQINASRGFYDLKQRVLSLGTHRERKNTNRLFLFISAISIISSVGFTISQARASTRILGTKNPEVGLMCSQTNHEKIIETWLKLGPSPNRSEM